MGSVYEDIRSALMQTLVTWNNGLGTPYAIFDENKIKQPDINTIFIAATMLPSRTHAAELGPTGANMSEGFFQIDVCCPPDRGPGDGLAVADALQGVFKRGTYLSYGSVNNLVCESVSIARGIQDTDFYRIPVSVKYYAWTTN